MAEDRSHSDSTAHRAPDDGLRLGRSIFRRHAAFASPDSIGAETVQRYASFLTSPAGMTIGRWSSSEGWQDLPIFEWQQSASPFRSKPKAGIARQAAAVRSAGTHGEEQAVLPVMRSAEASSRAASVPGAQPHATLDRSLSTHLAAPASEQVLRAPALNYEHSAQSDTPPSGADLGGGMAPTLRAPVLDYEDPKGPAAAPSSGPDIAGSFVARKAGADRRAAETGRAAAPSAHTAGNDTPAGAPTSLASAARERQEATTVAGRPIFRRATAARSHTGAQPVQAQRAHPSVQPSPTPQPAGAQSESSARGPETALSASAMSVRDAGPAGARMVARFSPERSPARPLDVGQPSSMGAPSPITATTAIQAQTAHTESGSPSSAAADAAAPASSDAAPTEHMPGHLGVERASSSGSDAVQTASVVAASHSKAVVGDATPAGARAEAVGNTDRGVGATVSTPLSRSAQPIPLQAHMTGKPAGDSAATSSTVPRLAGSAQSPLASARIERPSVDAPSANVKATPVLRDPADAALRSPQAHLAAARSTSQAQPSSAELLQREKGAPAATTGTAPNISHVPVAGHPPATVAEHVPIDTATARVLAEPASSSATIHRSVTSAQSRPEHPSHPAEAPGVTPQGTAVDAPSYRPDLHAAQPAAQPVTRYPAFNAPPAVPVLRAVQAAAEPSMTLAQQTRASSAGAANTHGETTPVPHSDAPSLPSQSGSTQTSASMPASPGHTATHVERASVSHSSSGLTAAGIFPSSSAQTRSLDTPTIQRLHTPATAAPDAPSVSAGGMHLRAAGRAENSGTAPMAVAFAPRDQQTVRSAFEASAPSLAMARDHSAQRTILSRSPLSGGDGPSSLVRSHLSPRPPMPSSPGHLPMHHAPGPAAMRQNHVASGQDTVISRSILSTASVPATSSSSEAHGGAAATPNAAPAPGLRNADIANLANRVYELLVRRLSSERQRRGM
jgi:hypothetical protein